MAKEVARRLTTVLAADIVSYTRLMELDTDGTLAAWQAARADVIEPIVAKYSGRIVKYTGDGFLAEFPAVTAAVSCAIVLQDGLVTNSLTFRMGVNLGDVVDDGEDIYGEGINVAARLEGLADPGSIYISVMVYEAVRNSIDANFEDLGEKTLKNVSVPMRVYRVGGAKTSVRAVSPIETAMHQQDVRYCTATDGASIAYATVGHGPPLVKAPNWMSHLEFEWDSPVWRHFVRELSKHHTLIRFDQRGNGLSDWDVDDISFEAFVKDLEAVTDKVGLDRFPLLGISQGCAISIAYAVRHPERVSKLILYGGFIYGAAKRGPVDAEQSDALNTLIRIGWGKDNAALRQMYTTNLIPGGSKEQMDWYNDLMRVSTSPENALRLRESFSVMDVSRMLSRVTMPTLIMHARNDSIAPFEHSRIMAATIPNARFVALEGNNHILLEDEPAWPRFVEEIRNFLDIPNGP